MSYRKPRQRFPDVDDEPSSFMPCERTCAAAATVVQLGKLATPVGSHAVLYACEQKPMQHSVVHPLARLANGGKSPMPMRCPLPVVAMQMPMQDALEGAKSRTQLPPKVSRLPCGRRQETAMDPGAGRDKGDGAGCAR